jgi:hypothetical protein
MIKILVYLVLVSGLSTPATIFANAAQGFDSAKIEEITGLKGKFNEQEEVFKISQPRTDVKVTVDRWAMPPFMGLTSWVTFGKGRKSEVMIMGDLVLFQDEVNPVMSVLFENGIDVTALHNHFFYDEPKVYYMHLAAEGSLASTARGVRAALDKVKAIRQADATPAKNFETGPIPEKNSISGKEIEAIFKKPGDSKDGMFKVVIGLKTKMACGCDAGKDMGVNTWAAFAGSDDNAVVDGDFGVLENELQPVLRSLRKSNINVVALHHHMTGETPRVLFLHYWGRGKAMDLAKSIVAALEVQNQKKGAK